MVMELVQETMSSMFKVLLENLVHMISIKYTCSWKFLHNQKYVTEEFMDKLYWAVLPYCKFLCLFHDLRGCEACHQMGDQITLQTTNSLNKNALKYLSVLPLKLCAVTVITASTRQTHCLWGETCWCCAFSLFFLPSCLKWMSVWIDIHYLVKYFCFSFPKLVLGWNSPWMMSTKPVCAVSYHLSAVLSYCPWFCKEKVVEVGDKYFLKTTSRNVWYVCPHKILWLS